MKILFLTYDIPYPLDAGGKIRAYHLIKQLSDKHSITLFSYYREQEQLRYMSELEKYCQKIRTFKRMPVFSLRHILATLSHPNLTAHITHYCHKKLYNELEKELKSSSYDVLHFESFFTSHLLGKYSVLQVLGSENIEWKVFLEHAKRQRLPLVREAMILESFRTRRFEEKTFRKANICLAVSKENVEEIERVTGKKCYLIPNGVDPDYFKFNQLTIQCRRKSRVPKSLDDSSFSRIRRTCSIETSAPSNRPTILFVGNFKYIQNQDAALFLVKEIFPLIKKEIKNAKLLIVGRNPTRKIKNSADKDVFIDDKVEDIREPYCQADALVAPIRAGSGTKFKILEAMASGVPVVTTAVGSEGIEGQDGKEFLIREKSEDLAKAAIELLKRKDLKNKLIFNARRLVEEKYSWEKIVKELDKVYQSIKEDS